MRRTLAEAERDPAFAAEALTLPSEAFLADQLEVVDVDAIHAAREAARAAIGRALSPEFAPPTCGSQMRAPTRSMGPRSAGGHCAMPASPISPRPIPAKGAALAKAQFDAGRNMTDVLAALMVLVDLDRPERPAALAAFLRGVVAGRSGRSTNGSRCRPARHCRRRWPASAN